MSALVTGVAGFIGFHVATELLARGEEVIGIDIVNDYYDPALKQARLAKLEGRKGFRFLKLDIAEWEPMLQALGSEKVTKVVHLAAQAGVRYSLVNPFAYIRSNVMGHTVMLELARRWAESPSGLEHFVYASSSSVYGGNTKLPFSTADRVDKPISLYAATKKADELISHAYTHLFGFPQTGLRFFTVYGPWGRPDMALYLFTQAILAGKPIQVFNHGDMQRDFTYIDDIVRGILAVLDHPPAPDEAGRRAKVYNIGNNRSEPLERLIGILEDALGRKAIKDYQPLQPGDVKATYADIEDLQRDTGFEQRIPIDIGVPRFVEWYKAYHKIS